MGCTMFENFNPRRISLTETKAILNRNGNACSDEEVKKIFDFLYVLAELQVEHVQKTRRGGTHLVAATGDNGAPQNVGPDCMSNGL